MIRKNVLYCKLFNIETSSKSIFVSFMDSYRPELETCPVCGSTGNCRPHAYYDRWILDFHDGAPFQERLRILRLCCESCHHTHAVLPDFIIPYSSYGITFVLEVLQTYFNRSHADSLRTVDKICSFFGISCRLLYRWLDLFRKHKFQWLGVLTDSEVSDAAFIGSLQHRSSFSDFLTDFFLRISVSFLQNHANPLQTHPKGAYSSGRHSVCPCSPALST